LLIFALFKLVLKDVASSSSSSVAIPVRISLSDDAIYDKTSVKSYSGGVNATVFNASRDAFAKPLPSLKPEDLRKFTFGNKIFNTNWVISPASVPSLDGLGPLFNRVSCSGCHFKDGRGRPPSSQEEAMNSMLIRLSLPNHASYDIIHTNRNRNHIKNEAEGEPIEPIESAGVVPHPIYGNQLNDKAILGVPAEGRAVIEYEEIFGKFADGEEYSLIKPIYKFVDMAYEGRASDKGQFGNFKDINKNIADGKVLFSPRVANAVHGLGLLEAITEKTILSFADEDDKNQDGISGRPNYVWNAKEGKKTIGKFGWKANQPNLHQQAIDAAFGDIGLTSPDKSSENCGEYQTECLKSASLPSSSVLSEKHIAVAEETDLSQFQTERLVFYLQTLAVPARREINNPQNIRGEELFHSIGCSSCHKANITTGQHEIPYLSNQKINPYTDLLLHDMGEALADNRPDFDADGKEWRTPPLWGIGLVETVNGHTRFLHDGRARNLNEAIIWHSGEAEQAKQKYKNLPKKDREAIINFLKSL